MKTPISKQSSGLEKKNSTKPSESAPGQGTTTPSEQKHYMSGYTENHLAGLQASQDEWWGEVSQEWEKVFPSSPENQTALLKK